MPDEESVAVEETGKEEIENTEKDAIVWIRVQPKNRGYPADSRIGIVLPKGGTLLSPDPNNPGMALEVANDSGAWARWDQQPKPNFDVFGWETRPEDNGNVFYGWRLSNRDELLFRNVRFHFRWRGAGPCVAETEAGSCRGNMPDVSWQVGIALPNAQKVKVFDMRVCHADKTYQWRPNIDYFVAKWFSQGDPYDVTYKGWSPYGLNLHTRDARWVQVRVFV
jgi:hypothetical protein